ncbi:hypothetical protein G3M48_003565, partial [Beauveria asiatica]
NGPAQGRPGGEGQAYLHARLDSDGGAETSAAASGVKHRARAGDISALSIHPVPGAARRHGRSGTGEEKKGGRHRG